MVKSVVDGTLTWLLGDHLGSTSVTAQADGAFQSEMRYTAFGETRSSSGPIPTDYQYTGQRHEAEFGLYFYQARWYDPASAHFTQADTLIPEPGNPLALDRYAYVYYNPLKYTDPSGHIGVLTTDPMIRGASNTPLGGQSGYSSLNIDKSTEVGLPPWDHSDVAPIPEAGSHDLDFWAEHVGLEPGEIHEVF
jgi:RHS repeat-associated protein